VQWLVAMQAQDYAGAKWAIGTRLPGSTDRDIEGAFNRGQILRTHVLRPTWHFVAPADIRWLLALTAPRVHRANGHMYRRLALDAATFDRSQRAIAKALRGGQYCTRDELRLVLEKHGIATDLERMAYLLMHAELEGTICSGPRRGKQFTYALLEERVRPRKALSRDAALAQLARRFFTSRWPATPHDLAKWSGLTVTDARQGFEAAGVEPRPVRAGRSPIVHLLSIYDEYFSSYRAGSTTIGAGHALRRSGAGESGLYVIVVNGVVVGRWSRTLSAGSVSVALKLFRRVTAAERRALDAAVRRYSAFVGTPIAH
jgi:Winged helix DNA-binding domain